MRFLLLFTLLITGISYGQNMRTGYIVTTEGDTLQGKFKNEPQFFDYVEGVVFKPEDESNFNAYSPTQITEAYNGFILLKSMEISYNYSRIIDNDDLYDADYDKPDSNVTQRHFLEVTVEGAYSFLVFHTHNHKQLFYLLNPKGEVLPLNNTKVLNPRNKTKMHAKKEYVSTLYVQSLDCPKMGDKLNQLVFEKQNLEKYIIGLNRCSDETYKVIKKKGRSKSSFSLRVGANLSILQLQYYRYDLEFNPHSGTGIDIGVSYLLQKERWFPKYELRVDLDYISQKTTIKEFYSSFPNQGDFTFKFTPTILQFSLGPQFILGDKSRFKVFPAINGGVVLNAREGFIGTTYLNETDYIFEEGKMPLMIGIGVEAGYDLVKIGKSYLGVFVKGNAGLILDEAQVIFRDYWATAGISYTF